MILTYKLNGDRKKSFEVKIKADSIEEGDELMEEIISGKIDKYDLVNNEMDWEGYFPITSVSRDDLESEGFDISNVSDDDMRTLADTMGNAYCDNGYWIDLRIIAEEYLNIPFKEDKKERSKNANK